MEDSQAASIHPPFASKLTRETQLRLDRAIYGFSAIKVTGETVERVDPATIPNGISLDPMVMVDEFHTFETKWLEDWWKRNCWMIRDVGGRA